MSISPCKLAGWDVHPSITLAKGGAWFCYVRVSDVSSSILGNQSMCFVGNESPFSWPPSHPIVLLRSTKLSYRNLHEALLLKIKIRVTIRDEVILYSTSFSFWTDIWKLSPISGSSPTYWNYSIIHFIPNQQEASNRWIWLILKGFEIFWFLSNVNYPSVIPYKFYDY